MILPHRYPQHAQKLTLTPSTPSSNPSNIAGSQRQDIPTGSLPTIPRSHRWRQHNFKTWLWKMMVQLPSRPSTPDQVQRHAPIPLSGQFPSVGAMKRQQHTGILQKGTVRISFFQIFEAPWKCFTQSNGSLHPPGRGHRYFPLCSRRGTQLRPFSPPVSSYWHRQQSLQTPQYRDWCSLLHSGSKLDPRLYFKCFFYSVCPFHFGYCSR